MLPAGKGLIKERRDGDGYKTHGKSCTTRRNDDITFCDNSGGLVSAVTPDLSRGETNSPISPHTH